MIRGESGTGKTTLVNISRYAMINPGRVKNESSLPLLVLQNDRTEVTLAIIREAKDVIVVVDENVVGVYTHEFASAVNASCCYFVLITRNSLPGIPYSIRSIYRIERDNKGVHSLQAIYNWTDKRITPEYIVCEGSNSGYIFFKLLDSNGGKVFTAGGKDKVVSKAIELSLQGRKTVMIIADEAAFGPSIEKFVVAQKANNIVGYFPESFEYLLLRKSVLFKHNLKIQEELEKYE